MLSTQLWQFTLLPGKAEAQRGQRVYLQAHSSWASKLEPVTSLTNLCTHRETERDTEKQRDRKRTERQIYRDRQTDTNTQTSFRRHAHMAGHAHTGGSVCSNMACLQFNRDTK